MSDGPSESAAYPIRGTFRYERRIRLRFAAALLCLALLATCGLAWAQTNDVPRDHWAYEAVIQLAEKGYVLGYPDGNFLGDRTLTRYEFATLVKRVVDGLEERMAVAEEVAENATSAPRTASPVPPPVDTSRAAEAGVAPEDLDSIRKLVDEFKVEMTVIGTRLDKVEADIEQLHTDQETTAAAVFDPEGVVESTKADVAKLKTVKVSGYIQARYQTADLAKEDNAAGAEHDTFLVRRARIKVTGQPAEKTKAVVQLELAKNSVALKDTYLQYMFKGDELIGPSVFLGQMNWPFGYEVSYSSSKRETPERALFIRRFFPGERDQGAKYTSDMDEPFVWQIGAFNGTGIEKNSASDPNDAKDIIANVQWAPGDLTIGASYYVGQGVWKKFGEAATFRSEVKKQRYGIDLQYYLNRYTLKAEYVRGRGVDEADAAWDQSRYVDGYYAQLNYNLTQRNTLVARFSTLSEDPVKPAFGRRDTWELGWLHWLDGENRLKFFYKLNEEAQSEFKNDGFAVEWVGLY